MTIAADGITVTPVRTAAERRQFLRLPWQIYDRAGPWVPPLLSDVEELLDPRRHPFHRHGEIELFLARRDGKPVGRIAAIQNQAHLDVHGDGAGFFGFFESVDDPRVAGALLNAAEEWLQARGLTLMRGPMNPSVNEEIGLLLDDYGGQPVIMMPYNPPYYVDLLEKNGLERVRTLYAFLADRSARPTERQTRLAGHLMQRHGISIRTARINDAEREAAVIESIYNRAWEHLWGYVPMTHEEALYLTSKLKQVADERMILIAAVHGEPAAFTLAIPDYNQVLRHLNGRLTPLSIVKALYYRRRITRLRLLAMGVLKEHRRKGIEAILVTEMVARALATGYQEMEISWILEDNLAAINILKNAGVPRYRSYGIFERPLKPARECR